LLPGTSWEFFVGADAGVRVDVRVGDFLACDPSLPPFSEVEVLLADPSCSGSGLPEHHLGAPAPISGARLRSLAAFQARILRHAMRFPRVRTVVYSTCSTHRIENEDVVTTALTGGRPRPSFRVAEALSWWRNAPSQPADARDASPLPAWASHCIRCDPAVHRCRGFFLCRLDRKPPDCEESDDEQNLPAKPTRPAKRPRSAHPKPALAGSSVNEVPSPVSAQKPPQTKVADGKERLRPVAARRMKRRKAKAAAKAAAASAQPVTISSSAPAPKSRKKRGRVAGLRLGS